MKPPIFDYFLSLHVKASYSLHEIVITALIQDLKALFQRRESPTELAHIVRSCLEVIDECIEKR